MNCYQRIGILLLLAVPVGAFAQGASAYAETAPSVAFTCTGVNPAFVAVEVARGVNVERVRQDLKKNFDRLYSKECNSSDKKKAKRSIDTFFAKELPLQAESARDKQFKKGLLFIPDREFSLIYGVYGPQGQQLPGFFAKEEYAFEGKKAVFGSDKLIKYDCAVNKKSCAELALQIAQAGGGLQAIEKATGTKCKTTAQKNIFHCDSGKVTVSYESGKHRVLHIDFVRVVFFLNEKPYKAVGDSFMYNSYQNFAGLKAKNS